MRPAQRRRLWPALAAIPILVCAGSGAGAYDLCPGQAKDSCLSPRERYERDLYRSGHTDPGLLPHRLYREQLDRRGRARRGGGVLPLGESYAATIRLPMTSPAPKTVSRLDQVAPFLAGCMPGNLAPGRALTVRLAFRADGSLIQAPRLTAGTARPGDRQQETFIRSVLDAIGRCMPLPLSGGFDKAIAGRPYLVRFVSAATGETKR